MKQENKMKEEILDAINDAGVYSNEDKAQAIIRCVDVIDYLYETASKIVVCFIETQPCEKAQALSNHPEELAIKAMEAAMRQVAYGGRQPGEPVH
jgi:hypothetical protein